MQMNWHWMYNADRRSPEFMRGVHDFLNVDKANTRNGLMCCPCEGEDIEDSTQKNHWNTG